MANSISQLKTTLGEEESSPNFLPAEVKIAESAQLGFIATFPQCSLLEQRFHPKLNLAR